MNGGDTTHRLTDKIDPARADALRAALGVDCAVGVGAVLPPLAHLAYFWDPAAEDGLGRDGHERLGGLIPDLGLPVRMWAGD